MIVFTFKADPALAKRIKEAAAADDRCRSAFLRRLVARALMSEAAKHANG